jgi:hypothetical protein
LKTPNRLSVVISRNARQFLDEILYLLTTDAPYYFQIFWTIKRVPPPARPPLPPSSSSTCTGFLDLFLARSSSKLPTELPNLLPVPINAAALCTMSYTHQARLKKSRLKKSRGTPAKLCVKGKEAAPSLRSRRLVQHGDVRRHKEAFVAEEARKFVLYLAYMTTDINICMQSLLRRSYE